METRVRAIVIHCGKVLLIQRIKENEEYWVFPGGGVEETDENIEDALIRALRTEENKGVEAAETALAMVCLMKAKLPS